MRIAITGARGRLGSALLMRLGGQAPGDADAIGWTRAEFDLDDPTRCDRLVSDARPDVVIHAAAWTDVDGCARDPELALRRNGSASGVLARACAGAGVSMLMVSTNEVFDGERTDGHGYGPNDDGNPGNAYGRSKLAGEQAAREAFESTAGAALGIVRTAWLFGEGKPDFPTKIAAAARSALADARALRLVTDEIGTPTYVPDLADAIAGLTSHDFRGTHHVVNGGVASRADWARDVLARMGIDVPIEEISLRDLDRPSRPPRWGVLEPTPLPGGPLRPWRAAMADRIAEMAAVR
jgi:dTDP-4-dehydrorhamnose reductase